ncbi:hypothetical protein F01_310176 [Burkholderia cenocepacia]|nr:hypothetical protein F01_310176 [Burkholderia cenocepacia]
MIQQDRLLKLDTPLGPDVLLPQRAAGLSRIGRHYDFTLDVLSTRSDVKLKSLIGQPVTPWIQQPKQSYLPRHGYVYMVRIPARSAAFTGWDSVRSHRSRSPRRSRCGRCDMPGAGPNCGLG